MDRVARHEENQVATGSVVVSTDGTTVVVADGITGAGAIPYNRIRAISLPALDGG